MDFTGERFVPNKGIGGEIENEHLLRYYSIASLVEGKKVLDAASGSGYGTSLLAKRAAYAVGLDISLEAVSEARELYHRDNVKYIQGSITCLPFLDNSFDVVVSFETLEHVSEELQMEFLKEIKRVVRHDGILVMSTPDKKNYSDIPGYTNEYHVKELYRNEFKVLLASFFKNVIFLEQYATLGYFLQSAEPCSFHSFVTPKGVKGKYVVAACSDGQICESNLHSSVILDQECLYQKKVDRVFQLQDEIIEKNKIISGLEKWVAKCNSDFEKRGVYIDELQARLQKLQYDLEVLFLEKKEVSQQFVECSNFLVIERSRREMLESELDKVKRALLYRFSRFFRKVLGGVKS